MQIENIPETVLQVGCCEVYPERYEVRHAEGRVALTPLEMQILSLLARRPGMVVSRQAIREQCPSAVENVDDRSLSRRVQRLRQKLGASGEHIVAVPGVGYRIQGGDDGQLL